ncbi:hypothetical protein D3C78_1108950 [compost metagenome]
MLGILLKSLEVARLGGEIAVAPGQVAVDVEPRDPLAHQLHRLQPHQVQLPYPLLAYPAGKLAGVVTYAANELAAVAARGPPADAVGLKQDHLITGLGQIDGGVEAGEAAAYDADVGIQLTAELGPLLMVVAGGRVIGGHVLLVSVVSSCLHAQHPALVALVY